jgi:hypothetical protein
MSELSDTPGISSLIKRQWREKYDTALAFMEFRRTNPGVLIEIAAQHPLIDGVRPGAEFAFRLECGKDLFEKLASRGYPVEIYVPGSRHEFEGRADRLTLSKAGQDYLESSGVPREVIHGDDLNEHYKGDEGVYGSADECFVASSYFRDNQFGRLMSVASPAQMLRKTLHYIAFGVLPLNYTAPTDYSYHDYLHEIFVSIPHVLLIDGTLQDSSSEEARRLRRERRPHG